MTKDVARRLAELAKSFEQLGHAPERVAHFLMRCLFTMFAEDIGLLPDKSFTSLLKSRRGKVETFQPMLVSLWSAMDRGEFSPILEKKLLRFNGHVFADPDALPVTEEQLELLIEAAHSDWKAVEPAIFGTLLERALDPLERHKLGAHYTPRFFVERLIVPTLVEPLTNDWLSAKTAAITLAKAGKVDDACDEVKKYLQRLCQIQVLDPACGSGNFLYVALEHMKRLEGEARTLLRDLGLRQGVFEGMGFTVDPHQLLGIEVNPRAAAVTELVLWIGYLQWHLRTFGNVLPPEPVIKSFHNIQCKDALIEYTKKTELKDTTGEQVTRWDGHTFKEHPLTKTLVPDENARVPEFVYENTAETQWPAADYIIGNPPFLGAARMRESLGDGYAKALRSVYLDVPDSCDFVMYWWHKAATALLAQRARRFGFITTNSIRQRFNQRVVANFLKAKSPLSLIFAIPDHPWVDSSDGADVRIAMTVAESGTKEGVLYYSERHRSDAIQAVEKVTHGLIEPNLIIGTDVSLIRSLRSNDQIASEGIKPHGMGFAVTQEEAQKIFGVGDFSAIIKPYRNGRDLAGISRNLFIIDLNGLSLEEVRTKYPGVYQHVLLHVKPERDQNNEKYRRENWWLFGRKNTEMRRALAGLPRYIVTVKTSKHRYFTFLSGDCLPDSKLIAIALSDSFHFGVLSSRAHLLWCQLNQAHLGVGNDPTYVKATCFDAFPFPEPTDELRDRVRSLGEEVYQHCVRQQHSYPALGLGDIFDVLNDLRAGNALTKKQLKVHDQGLVTTLFEILKKLDEAVYAAYGWQANLEDAEILKRLVALNKERAEEEKMGVYRPLRPDLAKQSQTAAAQTPLPIEKVPQVEKTIPLKRQPWPTSIWEQAKCLSQLLQSHELPLDSHAIVKAFERARTDRVSELLHTLVSLGQVRRLEDGRFVAAHSHLRASSDVTEEGTKRHLMKWKSCEE